MLKLEENGRMRRWRKSDNDEKRLCTNESEKKELEDECW